MSTSTPGLRPPDELYTPADILDWFPPVDLDPFWSKHSAVRPKYYLTPAEDGFVRPWTLPPTDHTPFVWVNPPYSRQADGLRKCVTESVAGDKVVVALVQGKPGEKYWHEAVWPVAAEVGFLRGRVVHGREPGLASTAGKFGSALVVYGPPFLAALVVQQARRAARGHRHEPVWVRLRRA